MNAFFSPSFEFLRHPLYQLLLFLLLTLLVVPLIKPKSTNAVWNVAGILYIGFIITNAVFFWFADGSWTYFFTSMGASLLYILAVGILVSLLGKMLSITGSGESATIFVTIIYHPVVLLLMILVEWIIGLM